MVVIPREICRDVEKALAHEWIVTNNRDSYAAASISGALTRREHGLLVTLPPDAAQPIVTLAKLDEEVEVAGQVYRLGTNEYKGGAINPDGFLYLHQVEYDGHIAKFVFEAGRFQLTKTIWMEQGAQTTYIRYTLAEPSLPLRLTLLPFCDFRSNVELTTGGAELRLQIQQQDSGFSVRANDSAVMYRILVTPDAVFTPLDLWYWSFQLRAAGNVQTDLFVPGLFRVNLSPGTSCTLIATLGQENTTEDDIARSLESVRACPGLRTPASDKFDSGSFHVGQPGTAPTA